MGETCEFKNIEEANEILGLLMRHWNTIVATLYKDEVYVPLLQDENGVAHGNDWASNCSMFMAFPALQDLRNSPRRSSSVSVRGSGWAKGFTGLRIIRFRALPGFTRRAARQK
jgi:hypothetical protein